MRDPLERLTDDGLIVTGVARAVVPAQFEPVLATVVERVEDIDQDASLYLYGSVATGQAVPGFSDVDLLTVGLAQDAARALAGGLSVGFATLCRAVEIGAAELDDFDGESDEAYGGRVLLRHYCVHLSGPIVDVDPAGYQGDRRAARGFNGDIGLHAERWRRLLDQGSDVEALARSVARKTLLAVAGLVSIHDNTWTTDRNSAAARRSEVRPELAVGLGELVSWADGENEPTVAEVRSALEGVVSEVVEEFASEIGLWR